MREDGAAGSCRGTRLNRGGVLPVLSAMARICALGCFSALCLLSAGAQQLLPLGRADTWKRYAQFDSGRLPASTVLQNVTLVLRPSAPAALQEFLSDLQNPRSPQYRHWLMPDEFAKRFGPNRASLEQVRSWLRSGGVADATLSHSGLILRFSAQAGTIEKLFHTELRRLTMDDREHYANSLPAAIPVELRDAVVGVAGLDDFDAQPQSVRSSVSRAQTTGLGPADMANTYGLQQLHTQGINGAGISIAIVGRTSIPQDDVRAYRSAFGLPQNDFQSIAVPYSIATGALADEEEATFDLEVAGGAAPAANLIYVWGSTVDAAAEWVIDNRLATVLSESYAGCENAGDVLYQTLAMQAAAEGITWIGAAGDSGAAGCDPPGAATAANGLHANAPASTPGILTVGGTALLPAGESGWSSTNSVMGGGGGVSAVFGGPGYQSDFAPAPAAGRMLPDVAFSASPDQSPYAVVFQGKAGLAGGTSLAAQLFAGIVAVVDESLIANGIVDGLGLGDIHPILYRLSEIDPAAFHDVVTGTDDVPCAAGSPDCVNGALGYPALAGYDLATGLGSVDAYALAQGWSDVTFEHSTATLTALPSSVGAGQNTELDATVSSGGSPLANSPVQFYLTNATWQPNQILLRTIATNAEGVARFDTDALPAGDNSIEAIATGTTSVSAAPPVIAAIRVTGTPSALTVAQPPGPYTIGQSVVLQAVVTVPPGASLAGPVDGISCGNGTVAIYSADGSIQSGPVTIDADGAASLTTAQLSSGSNSLSVSYSGNCYVAPSQSAALSLTATAAAAPDFTLSVAPSVDLPAGGAGNLSLTVQPLNGFSQAVQFTCAASSASAVCSVPSSMDVAAITEVPVTITLANLGAQRASFVCGLVLILVPRRRRFRLLWAALASAMLLAVASCGSASVGGASSFNITVTASSGTLVHSAVIQVNVGQ